MNPGGSTNELYNQIGPGFAAFVVVFALALAIWFLVRSMNGHLRKVRYAQADEMAAQREAPARPESSTAGQRPERPVGE